MSLRIRYRIWTGPGESLEAKLDHLCLEQSVELPADVLPPHIAETVVGRVEALEATETYHVATVVFPDANIGGEITQFLNILFGNISLVDGVQVEDVAWEQLPADLMPGPRYGIAGMRRRLGVPRRALACTALKPLGSTAEELGDMAYRFALGGMDCIKDDHGLADQPYAPFQRRLEACVAGVERANRETGGTSGYWPHISAVGEDLMRRLEAAAQAGAAGVLVCPHLVGPAALADVARHAAGLPVMAHPAFSGSYTQPRHGMTRAFLFGALWRALGADFVIHPNAAGRFAFSETECHAIHAAARGPQAGHAAAWPTPGGGMQRATLARWVGAYGPDTCFLIGGSLYQHPDGLTAAAAEIHSSLSASHG